MANDAAAQGGGIIRNTRIGAREPLHLLGKHSAAAHGGEMPHGIHRAGSSDKRRFARSARALSRSSWAGVILPHQSDKNKANRYGREGQKIEPWWATAPRNAPAVFRAPAVSCAISDVTFQFASGGRCVGVARGKSSLGAIWTGAGSGSRRGTEARAFSMWDLLVRGRAQRQELRAVNVIRNTLMPHNRARGLG